MPRKTAPERNTTRPPATKVRQVATSARSNAEKTRRAQTTARTGAVQPGVTLSQPLTRMAPLPERAVIVHDTGAGKFTLLETALIRSDFWLYLNAAREHSGLDTAEFPILIKPDLGAFEPHNSTATDPQLVEHLIDLLQARGYHQVSVGDGRNSFDLWLENRDVLVLADMLGYRFVTRGGHPYEILDLGEDLADGGFPEGAVLYGSSLPRAWLAAGFRISFAKNKTDDANGFALGLQNVLNVLPLRDKDYHYRDRLKSWHVAQELLQRTPVDFSLIDAFVSNHGNAGSRQARPLETRCCIAGHHLLLTDLAAIRKMGADPDLSPLHKQVSDALGLPEPHTIDGDLTPYPGWHNVHPLMADAVRAGQQWPELSRALKPWLQVVDEELFPFKDPVNEQINHIVTRYLANVDDSPAVFWAVVGLNYMLAFLHQAVESLHTLYWKDSLMRQAVPLNIDLDKYSASDYESIARYLAPLEQLAHREPADANGLRWRYDAEGAVLFEFSRMLPIPFEDFVAHVDISKSIQYMNDYIGGLIIPVLRDSDGRVTHQAERNLYLPQPNYLVLYCGKEIDVTKLEHMQYGKHEQRMVWKTLLSENQSAEYDDGSVTFTRAGAEQTRVCIFGRQKFTLPLFWQIVNLDNYPALKSALFTHAYTTFFNNTLANFEAVYEGREVRIGRVWNPRAGEDDDANPAQSPAEFLMAALSKAQNFIERNVPDKENLLTTLFSSYRPQPERLDEDGFEHFRADSATLPGQRNDATLNLQGMFESTRQATRGFWSDLNSAIQKDWGVRDR
jgi:uncharacterized protein (DUF362 family)